MRRFEGRTVVVTGGNRGIGYAMAERFGQEGANLVIASVEEQVKDAAAEFGTVDVSIQNAGIITIAKVDDLTEKDGTTP